MRKILERLKISERTQNCQGHEKQERLGNCHNQRSLIRDMTNVLWIPALDTETEIGHYWKNW